MKPVTETERKIWTLKTSIRCNRTFLACVPKGADPKTEARIEADERELAWLLAGVA